MYERFACRYHQLPDNRLVKILRPRIDALRDQITSVDMFLSHTTFSLLHPSYPFLLELSGFSLLAGFSPVF
jgi:hypothetical protein